MKAKLLLLKHMTEYLFTQFALFSGTSPTHCLLYSWHTLVVQFLDFQVVQVRRRFTIKQAFVSLGLQTFSASRLRNTVGALPVSSSSTL